MKNKSEGERVVIDVKVSEKWEREEKLVKVGERRRVRYVILIERKMMEKGGLFT